MSSGLKRHHAHEADDRIPKKRPPLLEKVQSAEGDPFGLDEGACDHKSSGSVSIGDDFSDALAGEEVCRVICTNSPVDTAREHSPGSKSRMPPTGVEVRDMKVAEELFMSSTFKLQIDALLPNIRPRNPRNQPLDKFLFSLHAYLSSLPPLEAQHPLAAARTLSELPLLSSTSRKKKSSQRDGLATSSQMTSVPYPLPTPTEDANWKVAFEKPANITIVGSWINNVAVKRKDDEPWVVDVVVEMPSGLFQEKDYMNARFFHKRAFYLAVIAKHVSDPSSKLNVDAYYESKRGDPRLTMLILRPKHDTAPTDFLNMNAVIRIIPALSPSSPILRTRLSPTRSNLRVRPSDSPGSVYDNPPTPLYNAVLMLAFSPQRDALSVNTLRNDTPAYRDALSLLRVWANQWGYGEGRRTSIEGFEGSGPWWNSVLELLIRGDEHCGKTNKKRRPLGNGLSSYQFFKAALDFLSQHDFAQEPIFVKSNGGHLFLPEEYSGRYESVFVSSSCINVLAGVPLTSIEMLKHDARITLEVLNGDTPTGDPFTETFLTDHRDLTSRFDVVVAIDLSTAATTQLSMHNILEHGSFLGALLACLSTRLRHALGSRVKAFTLLHPPSQLRPLSQGLPTSARNIFVGLILDPEHAFRLVDLGPTATETSSHMAKAFRELWGNKAELRRFQDGSITESVVWHVRDSDGRAHIPTMIVRHILTRHFGVHDNAVSSWQSEFDALLRLPAAIASHYRASGFKAALMAFQKLTTSIKELDKELPLAVVSVNAIAPELRYTSVFVPTSVSPGAVSTLPLCSRFVPLISLNLEFEKSARWPDDLVAIQKMKLAFLERLAKALAKAIPGLHARVAIMLQAGVPPTTDHVQLEITTPDGWAFALRIWHDREATLLDRILHAPPGAYSPHDLENARTARRLHIQRFIAAPRHHRAIAALHHRFTAFGGTVRLVKRWLAAHWLLRLHVSEEAVEVLCAAVFAGVGPARVPNTRERGFACAIRLLRDWNWSHGATIPLYSDSNPGPDVYSSAIPGAKGVWVLRTEVDPDGRMWTVDMPDVVAAHRIRALAQATHEYLQGVESGVLDVHGIFVHPQDDYDFVVKLQPAVLPRYYQNVAADPSVWAKVGKFENPPPADGQAPLRPGFDPAESYLHDLARIYTDTAKFFYDPLGGDRFGGIWDPSISKPMPFRVMNRFSSIPAPKGEEKGRDRDLVVLNESAVLSEIVRMGDGLVLC